MEDLKLILYILAIVAYFIYTAWRKAFKTQDDDGRPAAPQERPEHERPMQRPVSNPQPQPRQQQRPTAPATSFEDILREMQTKMERVNDQNRAPVENPKPVLQPTMKPVAKERVPMRALSLENPEQAKLYKQERRERLAAADAIYEAKKLERKVIPNVYGELLQNPQSARQAFIMSEIFNRKQY
ncbi:hypothetical protein H9Q13_03765 [Pontibacter sp. JH31]|uniref:Uncharacterized protein n=1 Tax=Pontibacter aquaedesilientis TaxID=2766980 RepID=A0ABR7XDA4_9BACT|nr:hypothetical protein [Pontibacter aquaedesilientis]MBD1396273.1 hypothetical protein [Pontibacter aquaedesilientis]